MVAVFRDHQLVGDSMLLRFATSLLFCSLTFKGCRRFCGTCVSGQTIKECAAHVQKESLPSKVLLMIGTNDFVKGASLEQMKNHMQDLLDILQNKVEKIVILTLPPVPALGQTKKNWVFLKSYNEWLLSLHNDKSIHVIDISDIFANARRKRIFYDKFERRYNNRSRTDLVHWNKKGMEEVFNRIVIGIP